MSIIAWFYTDRCMLSVKYNQEEKEKIEWSK